MKSENPTYREVLGEYAEAECADSIGMATEPAFGNSVVSGREQAEGIRLLLQWPVVPWTMLSEVQWTRNGLVARADKLCAAVHLVAWFVVALVWAVNWRLNGPSPSGPLFNFAYRFIGRIDYFVKAPIEDLTIKIGQAAARSRSISGQPSPLCPPA